MPQMLTCLRVIRIESSLDHHNVDGPGSLSKTGATWQTACKPNSVEDGHSSRRRITAHAQATYPEVSAGPGNRVRSPRWRTGPARIAANWAGLRVSSLFGLAPCGVYHASAVTVGAVRSYRTFSPLLAKASGMFSVALAVSRP